MNRYGYYGQGDYKSKEWFVYDHKNGFLAGGYIFKTKKEVIKKVKELNRNMKEG